jgi:hypothetical protein
MTEQSTCRVKLVGGPKDGWVYDDIPTHWELTADRMNTIDDLPPEAITALPAGVYVRRHGTVEAGTYIYDWEPGGITL